MWIRVPKNDEYIYKNLMKQKFLSQNYCNILIDKNACSVRIISTILNSFNNNFLFR